MVHLALDEVDNAGLSVIPETTMSSISMAQSPRIQTTIYWGVAGLAESCRDCSLLTRYIFLSVASATAALSHHITLVLPNLSQTSLITNVSTSCSSFPMLVCKPRCIWINETQWCHQVVYVSLEAIITLTPGAPRR